MIAESRPQRLLRSAAGLVFLVAGLGKILLPVVLPLARPGSPDFGDVLGVLGVPLPRLAAVAIAGAEAAGGAALLAGRGVRLVAPVLGAILAGAMATLSVPAARGRPLHIMGITLGDEWWGLPLEAILIAMLGVVLAMDLREKRASSSGF